VAIGLAWLSWARNLRIIFSYVDLRFLEKNESYTRLSSLFVVDEWGEIAYPSFKHDGCFFPVHTISKSKVGLLKANRYSWDAGNQGWSRWWSACQGVLERGFHQYDWVRLVVFVVERRREGLTRMGWCRRAAFRLLLLGLKMDGGSGTRCELCQLEFKLRRSRRD